MNKQIHSPTLFIWILTLTIGWFLNTVQAGTLLIYPVAPVVEVGQSITLSVYGASDNLKWTALEKGRIEGEGSRVTYVAPEEVGIYPVLVQEGTNVGTVMVSVLAKGELARKISLDNAVWELMNSRHWVKSMALSKDEKILWVGTNAGLEQRDASTGQLIKVFTILNGLPHNNIEALAIDNNDGLWVGTSDGLAHLHADGTWFVYNENNSGLSNNRINTLLVDEKNILWVGTLNVMSKGGLHSRQPNGDWQRYPSLSDNSITTLALGNDNSKWIGTRIGITETTNDLVYYHDGEKQVFNTDNSKLPSNWLTALQPDQNGGIWIGTKNDGLFYRSQTDEWSVFTPDKLPFPSSEITSIITDNKGGIWIGSNNGLVHLNVNHEWTVFNTDNSGLPNNFVSSLLIDANGDLWVGTGLYGLVRFSTTGQWTKFNPNFGLQGEHIKTLGYDNKREMWVGTNLGLAHLMANYEWEIFNSTNSALPANSIYAFSFDKNGGLWVGTFGSGLAYRKNSGEWTLVNTTNSPLPDNFITALLIDEQDGLWIGTENGGLAYRDINNEWQIFNIDNSALPYNSIRVLIVGDSKGIWIGTGHWFGSKDEGGLAHLGVNHEWQVFTTANSKLPNNNIRALLSDDNAGLWIGTSQQGIGLEKRGGLVYRNSEGKWRLFPEPPENLSLEVTLSYSRVNSLLADGNGGLWIGTYLGGLVHQSAAGKRTIFNTRNSGVPNSEISTLLADKDGSLWVGTYDSGLARLSFSQKRTLASIIKDKTIQNPLLTEKRAAILIHPRGQSKDTGYSQELAVDFMATYAYHTLHARGYDNDEIYFLSYKPDLDFNGDAIADFNVVDAPIKLADFRQGNEELRDLTVTDVDKAFEWTTEKGHLDQPLLVIFIDHGLKDKLLLAPSSQEMLTADKFKTLLDDYQIATGNKVVVILEACHTGTLVPTLAAPNRTIISSTGEDLAYYNDLGRTSFLRFYFNQLRRGDNLHDSWQTVDHTFDTYGLPFIQQNPQLNDSAEGIMAQSLCLNGCFALPGVPTLTPQIATHQINAGQTIELNVATQINGGSVRRVWASIITPDVNSQRNEQGYSLLSTPVTYLQEIADGQWQGNYTFDANATPGDEYTFTFKVEDNTKFVTEAQPITITLGKNQYASFNPGANMLYIPAVTVKTEIYQANLIVQQIEPEIILELDMSSIKPAMETLTDDSRASFNSNTGVVQIPLVTIGPETFSATLQLIPETSPLQFRVESITLQR